MLLLWCVVVPPPPFIVSPHNDARDGKMIEADVEEAGEAAAVTTAVGAVMEVKDFVCFDALKDAVAFLSSLLSLLLPALRLLRVAGEEEAVSASQTIIRVDTGINHLRSHPISPSLIPHSLLSSQPVL